MQAEQGIEWLALLDLRGREAARWQGDHSEQISVSVAGIEAGIYFLKVKMTEGVRVEKVVVVANEF